MLPKSAPYFALFSNGTESVTMMKLPAKIPALPTPEMALPMINIVELVDAPQMADPTSKIMMATTYAHFKLNSVKNRPHNR